MIPPDVPDATIIGLSSRSGPRVTDRSAVMEDPEYQEYRDAARQHRVRNIEVRTDRHQNPVAHRPEHQAVVAVPDRPRQDERAAGHFHASRIPLPQEREG